MEEYSTIEDAIGSLPEVIGHPWSIILWDNGTYTTVAGVHPNAIAIVEPSSDSPTHPVNKNVCLGLWQKNNN